MKMKTRLGLLVALFSLCTIGLPSIASAGRYHHHHCGSCYGNPGIIYSSEGCGGYVVVPGGARNTVYRSVDGKYIPVGKYGYACSKKYACYCKWPRVVCQTRCAHWEGPVWVGPSKVCYYVR
jgi:hypothetical protein